MLPALYLLASAVEQFCGSKQQNWNTSTFGTLIGNGQNVQ